MRVLHVITSLHLGGAEKLMVDLLPRMKKRGCEVDLCVFDGERTPFSEELERRNARIITLHDEGGIYSLSNVLKLIPLMKAYDVVHVHNTPCQIYAALANIFVKKRLITTEHSTSNRRRGKWWLKPFDAWLYRQFEKIVCVSDAAAKNIVDYVGTRGIHVQTISNGIDTTQYENAQISESLVYGFPNVRRILMVAGFRYEKDQKTVIRACALLPDNYHLFLVGDGDKRAEIEDLIASLEVDARVHLLGIRGDVKELLKAADVVVMSSHREGLSLSSLEGMACGRPFVASDVEGLRDIVGGYGVLFPHEDANALAHEIQNLCEDAAYAEVIVARCQKRVKMFDIEVMVQKYLQLYT